MKTLKNSRFLLAAVVAGVLIAYCISYHKTRLAGISKMRASMRQCSLIVTGLIACAQDDSRNFPTDTPLAPWTNSNQAYSVIASSMFAKGLIDQDELFEAFFFEPGNPWNRGKTSKYTLPLRPGDNHWGYVKNLTLDRSHSDAPLIMSGGLMGNPGHWGHDPTTFGGVAPGGCVLIFRVSGSAKACEPNNATPRCVEVSVGGKMVDLFSTAGGVNPADCLNPE